MSKVSNKELLLEIFRSRLSYTDLTRREQRDLPFPDAFVDRTEDAHATGLVMVTHSGYLDYQGKLPFPPFQLVRDGQVIASAFIRNGQVSVDHGRVTERLGALIVRLVENYSTSKQWRYHNERDEMIGFAVVELLAPALRYDLTRWRNPFATLTQNTYYAFCKVARKAVKRAADRHDMLEDAKAVDQFAEWKSQQDETDHVGGAYEFLRGEMDRLLIVESERSFFAAPRKLLYKLSNKGDPIAPSLRAAILYGLSIGLSGKAVSDYFGIDPAIVSKMKNNKR